jgi:glutathione S-transferase
MFFNRVVAPKFLKREGDLAVADAAERDELPRLLAYLDDAIPASGFLVDDRLTLADIAVAAILPNLEYAGCPVDAAAHPRLAAWSAAILARPSFTKWTTKERAMFGLS